MITKTDLGYTEQLCSQMGQYAMLHHVSRLTGHELVFIRQELTVGRGVKLFEAFELPNRIVQAKSRRLYRRLFLKHQIFQDFEPVAGVELDPRIYSLSRRRNYNLKGFFGLYRHWESSLEQVLDLFSLRQPFIDEAARNILRIRAGGEADADLVSIHFRRADYLESSVHVNLSIAYYAEAIRVFTQANSIFVVFSDDIAWCKELDFLRPLNVVFSESSNYVDLAMMSLCNHHITSNSSFAFWGALLNRGLGKKVVCPHNFVRPECDYFNWINGNYYPSSWLALDLM